MNTIRKQGFGTLPFNPCDVSMHQPCGELYALALLCNKHDLLRLRWLGSTNLNQPHFFIDLPARFACYIWVCPMTGMCFSSRESTVLISLIFRLIGKSSQYWPIRAQHRHYALHKHDDTHQLYLGVDSLVDQRSGTRSCKV